MKVDVKLYKHPAGMYAINISGIKTCLLDAHAIAVKINDQMNNFLCSGGIPMCNIFSILNVSEWIPYTIRRETINLQYTKRSDIEVFPDGFLINGLEEKYYGENDDFWLTWNTDPEKSRKIFLEWEAEVGIRERYKPRPIKVIFNNPATIVIWSDGTKTVVKCDPKDTYSKEAGLALCYMKKVLGNKGNYNNMFRRWIKDERLDKPTGRD